MARPTHNAKKAIAETFVDQVVAEGLSKVCVLDLVKAAGINKNSFYYHFSSRDAVAQWVFRSDIADMLEGDEQFDPQFWVYESVDESSEGKEIYPDLPYYVRIQSGARTFNQGAFFKATVLKMRERREFYKAILRDTSNTAFSQYLDDLYRKAFLEDVNLIADGRYLPPETKSFLAGYFLESFTGCIDHLVCEPNVSPNLFDDNQNPFWNIGVESLAQAIRVHPFNSAVLDMMPFV